MSFWGVIEGWTTLRRGGALLGGVVALLALPAAANASLATTPTPYMGWNPYYANEGYGSEATFEAVANSLTSTGLQNAGYKIFWLDYGWWSGTASRDSTTDELTVDPSQWPTGMSGFTAWLHAHGFLAGIYTDAGTSGCSGKGVGSYGHYAAGSTNPYSLDANQFAAWGFDAVKVDFCGAGQQWLDQPPYGPRTLYGLFSSAVADNSSGRPMILNVCNFWTPGQINSTQGIPSYSDSSWDNYQWAPAISQSWRTDTDVGSWTGVAFKNVLRNLDQDSTPQPGIQNAAGPPGAPVMTYPDPYGPPTRQIAWGHWNDPDYLTPGFLTSAQAQSEFSMWAMVGAPLILGTDPQTLSSSTISMLENQGVIAIDQDSLGAQGYPLSQPSSSGQQVWVKPLANGDRAVALFNRGSSAQQVTTTASAVGLPPASSYQLLNLWTNTTTTTSGTISATVGPGALVLYRVTPVAPTAAPVHKRPPRK
jgi:alpha-galactosidase